jgi:putative hydrolase of the HAD superfamily
MLKVVSFDVVGTLVDFNYEGFMWKDAIPRLFAGKRGMRFEEAKDYVLREYDRIGKSDIRWFLPEYWFKHFNLDENPMFVFKSHVDKVRFYPEVSSVLKNLSRKFDLVIVSGTTKKIIGIMIEKFRHYFKHFYSPVSNHHEVKKTPQFYEMVCRNLGVEPSALVHVGDEWYSDFIFPRSIGIESFYLDRTGEKSGKFVVKDLRELQSRIVVYEGRE